jgi:L-alanine-DL-glutamate epimerase-like enolase superfamily enzyme
MMDDLAIEQVAVYVVGPQTERYAWASDMDTQYMTNTIIRAKTRGGLEGVAGVASFSEFNFDRAIAETIRPMLPHLIGASPDRREALWHKLFNRSIPGAPQAQSAVDILMWDLAAKAVNLPLYRFLGAYRDSIPAYASTPLFTDAAAYVDNVHRFAEEGFSAVKFHCWCEYDRDLEMIRAVHKEFGTDKLRFMLDVEQRYDRTDAMRMAKQLEPLDYFWFEAPLVDYDLAGYRELRKYSSVPIIAAGNSIIAPQLIETAIDMGCWTQVRVDATVAGGITGVLKIMGLAEARGMTVELQSWGYTTTQAANLHLMLARPNCTYFEQPVPYPAFEYGFANPIRPGKDGHVRVSGLPGLGLEVDWAAIESASILKFEETKRA